MNEGLKAHGRFGFSFAVPSSYGCLATPLLEIHTAARVLGLVTVSQLPVISRGLQISILELN